MKLSNLKPMHSKAKERRKNAIERLQKQLKEGTKPNKFGTTKEKKDTPRLPLTDKDIKRIEAEISVLKTRI